jgi:3-hydroxybutyryl-CoA dehydratase
MNEYRFSDLYVGVSYEFEVTLSTQMMESFKILSGDENPLHTDKEFALSHGYEDCVVYGMLTASFYSTLVGMFLPGKYALLQGVDANFISPVFIGDKLSVYGEITSIHNVFRQIEIRANIKNHLEKKVSKAKIKCGINE